MFLVHQLVNKSPCLWNLIRELSVHMQANNWLKPLGVLSSYGLFASMTTFRHELVLEVAITTLYKYWSSNIIISVKS